MNSKIDWREIYEYLCNDDAFEFKSYIIYKRLNYNITNGENTLLYEAASRLAFNCIKLITTKNNDFEIATIDKSKSHKSPIYAIFNNRDYSYRCKNKNVLNCIDLLLPLYDKELLLCYDKYKECLLNHSVSHNKYEIFKIIFKKYKNTFCKLKLAEIINLRTEHLTTMLHEACKYNNISIIKTLLKNGGNLSNYNGLGEMPMNSWIKSLYRNFEYTTFDRLNQYNLQKLHEISEQMIILIPLFVKYGGDFYNIHNFHNSVIEDIFYNDFNEIFLIKQLINTINQYCIIDNEKLRLWTITKGQKLLRYLCNYKCDYEKLHIFLATYQYIETPDESLIRLMNEFLSLRWTLDSIEYHNLSILRKQWQQEYLILPVRKNIFIRESRNQHTLINLCLNYIEETMINPGIDNSTKSWTKKKFELKKRWTLRLGYDLASKLWIFNV